MIAPILVSAAGVFILDQLTKAAAVHHCARFPSGEAGSGVHARCAIEASSSPALTRRRSGWALLTWAILAGIILTATERGVCFQCLSARIAVGLALGGAASNASDRVRRGGVVDFIDFGWWPVFNLADVAIVLGAAVALWQM